MDNAICAISSGLFFVQHQSSGYPQTEPETDTLSTARKRSTKWRMQKRQRQLKKQM